jgi:hypothetical protein
LARLAMAGANGIAKVARSPAGSNSNLASPFSSCRTLRSIIDKPNP